MATRGHVDKGTWGQGVVSPLCGVALFQVGIALRAILEASKVGAWLRRALLVMIRRARSISPFFCDCHILDI